MICGTAANDPTFKKKKKKSNIHNFGVSEGEESGIDKVFKEIMLKIPTFVKDKLTETQEEYQL